MGLDQRLQLHELLIQKLETLTGKRNVYFQEPENYKMEYPCILYKLDTIRTQYASNLPYRQSNRWQITIVDRDPESSIPEAIGSLPTASFSRRFVANNLNHTIYTLYF